jgi:type IV fimbrial biogenesis protein FimT
MRGEKGLTLVELMVTLAVAIILLAVGMPMFSGVVANNRATTQANALMSAMKLARSEAVKRAMDVSVCATNAAQNACDSNSPPDWTNGWFVYADLNDNGSFDFPGDIIRSWEALAGSAGVTVTAPGGITEVAFRATGAANGAFAFETNDTQASGSNADRAKRCVILNAAGQVRVKRPDLGGAWTCP